MLGSLNRTVYSSQRNISQFTLSVGVKLGQRLYSNAADLPSKGPWIYNDSMSPVSCHKLDATLESHIPVLPTHPLTVHRKTGMTVPKGYHFIYFNSASPEDQLGSDGYDGFQAPNSSKFPFRMWAGGSVEFKREKQLVLGHDGNCVEVLTGHQHKIGDKERVNVELERYISNASHGDIENYMDNWAIKETRKMVYFTASSAPNRSASAERVVSPGSKWPLLSHAINPTMVLLFRYSALTFNSHFIHYDKLYSRDVEGLPDVLVQGPLMVTAMLRWLDELVVPQLTPGKTILKFEYKNLIPLFVNQTMTLACGDLNDNGTEMKVWIENEKGSPVLRGKVELA
jgi:hydroxyacyl-ACP dehydratase HTD2-like protein with hotdog domain